MLTGTYESDTVNTSDFRFDGLCARRNVDHCIQLGRGGESERKAGYG